MFWRNMSFRNPFQRTNNSGSFPGAGYNPQLNNVINPQLSQNQNFAGQGRQPEPLQQRQQANPMGAQPGRWQQANPMGAQPGQWQQVNPMGAPPQQWQRTNQMGAQPQQWQRTNQMGSQPQRWQQANAMGAPPQQWQRTNQMGAQPGRWQQANPMAAPPQQQIGFGEAPLKPHLQNTLPGFIEEPQLPGQTPQIPPLAPPQTPQLPPQAPQLPPQINRSFGTASMPQSQMQQKSPFGSFGFTQPQASGLAAQQPQQPQLPSIPQPSTEAALSFPQQAATPQPGEQSPPEINGLKNTGTFMGYPEYTLDGTGASIAAQPAQLETGRSLSAPNPPSFGQESPAKASGGAPSVSIFEGIKELSQNERNGSEYYKNLAEKSWNERARAALNAMADSAWARSRRLMELNNTLSNESFMPESRTIKTDISYEEGLRLAIKEETASLRSCSKAAETMDSSPLKEKLNSVIVEKLCQINELNALLLG